MFNLLYLYSTSRLGVELGVWGDETEVNLSAPKTTTLNVYLLSYLKNYLLAYMVPISAILTKRSDSCSLMHVRYSTYMCTTTHPFYISINVLAKTTS